MVSRIKQLLDWQQLSPTQFADRIGVGRPVVSHILSERNKPSLDVVRNIKKTFPELSLDWLLDGTGEMLAVPLAATSLPPASSAAPLTPAVANIPAEQPTLAGSVVSVAPAAPGLAAAAVVAAPAAAAAPAVGPVRPVAAPPPAARFRPGGLAPDTRITQVAASLPPSAPMPLVEPALPVEPSRPAPAGLPAPAASPDVAPLAQALPAPGPPTPPPTDPTAGFGEPGKPIRRIVIFYRDGSFADYQPEG